MMYYINVVGTRVFTCSLLFTAEGGTLLKTATLNNFKVHLYVLSEILIVHLQWLNVQM